MFARRSQVQDLNSVQLRGQGWFGQEVVGESYYFGVLRKMAGRVATGEREVLAHLRLEPTNPHDSNAIQVLLEGNVVGYLPREDAKNYQVPLARLAQSGYVATCRARLWWSRERDDFLASVSLDIAEPEVLLPINAVDHRLRHVIVPPLRSYQLSRENEHMDVLGSLISRAYLPGKALAFASLRVVERSRPRSVSHVVAVFIDGQEIGDLSKQTSAKFVPLLQRLHAAGLVCYADVLLTGNFLAVEAKLQITPPEELDTELVRYIQEIVGRSS